MSDAIQARGNSRNSGYQRNANDYYVEPACSVHALFDAEEFVGSIHDPACGGGNIPRIAIERGYEASGSDVVDRGYGERRDFLADGSRYTNIVTNPPFNLATAFTLHALRFSSGKVAILQRLSWLEGQARHDALFKPGHLSRVYVFSKRISMPPGGTDIPAKGGSVAFAWFVFDLQNRGSPTLGWLA